MVGAVEGVSVSMVPMAKWRDGLWAELFDDTQGDGQPLSVIYIDDALLARAIARQGLALSDDEARGAFLNAFPARVRVQRWLVGSEDPGDALLPLLVLCCLSASEAAESDDNDYRGRMRDLMGWDDRIINCAGLPRLWTALRAKTERRAEIRPTRLLILPDPRFRTQIGHAIELTFPSRNDARRLVQELASATFDFEAPNSVIAWLAPLVARRRFSSTFEATFNNFRAAWLSAERALADHRFWSGWKLVTHSFRSKVIAQPFEIAVDEWGQRHLIDPVTEEAIDLNTALRGRTMPALLVSTATKSQMIPLTETEWGRLRWLGYDREQTPSALLIDEKAFKARYVGSRSMKVSGAEGWVLTFDVAGKFGKPLPVPTNDRLLEVIPTGCTRVDGGVLARPAFPFFIETKGPSASLALVGANSVHLELRKVNDHFWKVTPQMPIEGEIRIVVESSMGGLDLERILRLRRTILVPEFRKDIPERLYDFDPSPKQGWPLDQETPEAEYRPLSGGETAPTPALLDLLEYFAIRTAPIPLSGLLELLRSFIDEHTNPWDVIQSLRDAGVIKVLGVRGWRGSVVLARGPQSALVRSSEDWILCVEGCVSETWVARFHASANQYGLAVELKHGVGAWSPPTFMVRSPEIRVLREIAKFLDAPISFLAPGLRTIKSIFKSTPLEISPKRLQKQPVKLSRRHAPISFIETQVSNQSPFWEVNRADGARYWKIREDAVLDAYLTVGERPFGVIDGRLVASHARLPDHVARWVRMVSGVAAGPVGEGYGYACDTVIRRELAWVEPAFFSEHAPTVMVSSLPLSRRWSLRAVATANGPHVIPGWSASRLAREGE